MSLKFGKGIPCEEVFRTIEPDYKVAYLFATAWISAKGIGEEFKKALDENRIQTSPIWLIPTGSKLQDGKASE